MLDIVRREEAEGERRMIGSLGRCFCGGPPREEELREEDGGARPPAGNVVVGAPGFGAARNREMKSSACLRTWEKSCLELAMGR